jgi:hypothetical protein
MKEGVAGAQVKYCNHDGWFVADIHVVGNVNVIRANGPVNGDNIIRTNEATHVVTDFPKSGFWRPDLGVFVVPQSQVKALRNGKVRNV